MSATKIKELSQTAEQIAEQRELTYLQLARNASQGELPDAITLADTLRDANKSENDFNVLVKAFEVRQQLRIKRAAIAQHEARRDALQANIDGANAKLEVILEDHRSQVRAWHLELAPLGTLIAEGAVIPANLQRSCPCPRLRAKLQQQQRTMWQIQNHGLQTAKERLHFIKGVKPENAIHEKSLAESIARAESELAALRCESADLVREMDATVEAMIDF